MSIRKKVKNIKKNYKIGKRRAGRSAARNIAGDIATVGAGSAIAGPAGIVGGFVRNVKRANRARSVAGRAGAAAYKLTAARKAALKKAQAASARMRKGKKR